MDDYSFRCNCLTDYKKKNDTIRKDIETLKAKLAEQRKTGFRYWCLRTFLILDFDIALSTYFNFGIFEI
jgi:hypothetical protein